MIYTTPIYKSHIFLFVNWKMDSFSLIAAIAFIVVLLILLNKIKKLKEANLELISDAAKAKEVIAYATRNKEEALNNENTIKNSKRILVSKLSYEIRSAINGINSIATILQQTALTHEQNEYCNSIINCSELFLKNSDKLLKGDFSVATDVKNTTNPEIKNEINFSNTKTMNQKITIDFAKQHPRKILIAEDDKINTLLALKLFSLLGYKADNVENGKEALDAVSEKNYDIIFMDVFMAGMDGLEATKMIRLCLDKQPVIIALTAGALDGDKERCLQAGMNDYLSKPIHLEELITLIEKWEAVDEKLIVSSSNI